MRLDDRVAFKVASRAVNNFAADSMLNGPIMSMSQLLGRYLQSAGPCLRSARKVADKIALAARPKTILAKTTLIPDAFVGVKMFKLLKTSPYAARATEVSEGMVSGSQIRKIVADTDGLSLIRIMHSTYLFKLPESHHVRNTQLTAYITRHAIERFFKRTGSTRQAVFEKEIRESTEGFLLAYATALTHPTMKQAWALTKSGLFVGFVERDEKGFCWITYTTFIEKGGLSGRWMAAHRLSQRFMGSTTYDACSLEKKELCYETLERLMAWYEILKSSDAEDGDRVLQMLNLMEKHPMLTDIDNFIEGNAWVTRDHLDLGDPRAAAWDAAKRLAEESTLSEQTA